MFSNYTDVYCTYKRFLYLTNLKTDTNLTFQDSILKFQVPIFLQKSQTIYKNILT